MRTTLSTTNCITINNVHPGYQRKSQRITNLAVWEFLSFIWQVTPITQSRVCSSLLQGKIHLYLYFYKHQAN